MTPELGQRERPSAGTWASHAEQLLNRFDKAPLWLVGLVLFVIALAVRITLILVLKTYQNVEISELSRVAISLATQGRYADAFGPGTGPTAHVAPIYPLLLSLLYRVFGTGVAAELAREIFASSIAALQYALLPLAARSTGLGRRVGTLAALGGAMLPLNFWGECKGSWEASLAGLTGVCLVCWTATTWRKQRFTAVSGALNGLLCGLAALVSAAFLPVAAALLGAAFLFYRGSRRRILIYACATGLMAMLTLTPWAIRNKIALGKAVWTRSNLGLELFLANNDESRPEMDESLAGPDMAHPYTNAAERRRLVQLGEINYQSGKQTAALRWIEEHPRRFAWLTLQRIWLFWLPETPRPLQTLLFRLVSLLGLVGAVKIMLERKTTAAPLYILLLVYPLVYYVMRAHARYRYPIDWVTWMFAAVVVLGALAWIARRYEPALTRRNALAAGKGDG